MMMLRSKPYISSRQSVGLWLLICLVSTLSGCAPAVQRQPAVAGERVVQVVLYNATGETLSVWTLAAEPRCLVCPADPLLPGASRRLELAPGPVTWEVVAVPYGDFATAYRLPTVTAVIAPGAVTEIILSGPTPES
jgi:hypothetical protein